jgi:2-polyprenyl-3-methyl-5-hydroxy-6-metoxy-1,4-benzoquinol methylase
MEQDTATGTPAARQDGREALAERLFGALVGAVELYTVQVGLETGLYEQLADSDVTASQLARRADLDHRYVGEWLQQQAVAGIVVVDTGAGEEDRLYRLDPAHAEVLLSQTSPYYLAPAGPFAVGVGRLADAVATAFRTGGGVPYSAYGAGLRRAIAAFNRPMVEAELAAIWLPAVPEVHDFLAATTAPRILDLGCGLGRTTVELARAYPHATVHGVDLDTASVDEARKAAAEAGVADRVAFSVGDAVAVADAEPYHLVTAFETLHDMGDPVGALRNARQLLAPGARVLVSDDRAAESFVAPGDDYERLLAAFSVMHCLPATRAADPVHAHGTLVRPQDVLGWIDAAGYRTGRVLDIPNDMWRFYLATP